MKQITQNINFEIRKTKANALCRICNKKIYLGQSAVFVGATDGYNQINMCLHLDCSLNYIINKINKIKLDELKKEQLKFDKIKKLLEI